MTPEKELQALREENRLLKALVAELLPLKQELAGANARTKELEDHVVKASRSKIARRAVSRLLLMGLTPASQRTRRIPMTHTNHDSEDVLVSQEAFEQMLKERLRQAVRIALISVLEEEVTAFIGAKPYERNEERRDHHNGHYTRDLATTLGRIADLPVPRTHAGHQTQVFERYHRRQGKLDSAIGEMFVKGVSTAKVGEVIKTLPAHNRAPQRFLVSFT